MVTSWHTASGAWLDWIHRLITVFEVWTLFCESTNVALISSTPGAVPT
jgi:hypothetical protein